MWSNVCVLNVRKCNVMYLKVSPEDKLMEAFKGSQLSSRTFGRDKNTITLSFPLHNNTSQLRYITSRYITLHYIASHHIRLHFSWQG